MRITQGSVPVIPGTGAANLGKAEDAPHSSGDVGVMSLVVRNDTLAALSGLDGDYSPLQVDSLGALYTSIRNNNVVSTDNSSASTLLADAVFTGTSEETAMFASVSVQVFASHASAASGLSMEFSTDNSNWDEKHTATVAAATEREFIFPAHAKYFRIVYTNGGTNQTAFRLQTILHVQGIPGSAHALEDNSPADAVGVLTKSVLIAQAAGSGDFVPVQSTMGGNLKVSVEEADTSASGLAKAIDNVAGATDVGVAMLAKHVSNSAKIVPAAGDYDVVQIDDLGGLQVRPEQHNIFDEMDVTTDWTVLGNDTINLATTKKHVLGTDALTFDKTDGGANTVFAGIQKTITSIDLGSIAPHDIIQTIVYIPDLNLVDYAFVRIGTDSTNYNEWRVPDTSLTDATFETLALNIGDASHAGITGDGWTSAAITYIAVGVAFDAEGNALAGIIFDELSFHTNQHTSASLNAEVSSEVSSANINLHKVGGSPTNKGAGNVGNGSQRIVIATDDINVALISAGYNVAHDAVDSGNPVKFGYKAIAHGANPTAVAANDRTQSYANRHGIPWVIGGHPNIITTRASATGAQTNASIITVGAGTKIVITRITFSTNKATSVNVSVIIGFGATTTPTGVGVVLSHSGMGAGESMLEGSGAGILGIGGGGEDLRLTSSVATDGNIEVVVSYYLIES